MFIYVLNRTESFTIGAEINASIVCKPVSRNFFKGVEGGFQKSRFFAVKCTNSRFIVFSFVSPC
jgi:hypothetical protein